MTTYVGKDRKGPNEIQPTTIDWEDWLAVTQDVIVDCDIFAPGVDVVNRWFTETDTTAVLGGGADGASIDVTMRIYCQSGEVYERTVEVEITS